MERAEDSGKSSQQIFEVGHGGELILPRIYVEKGTKNREIDS